MIKSRSKDVANKRTREPAQKQLTETQLRNARKRRAKQKQQRLGGKTARSGDDPNRSTAVASPLDPSAQYVSRPHGAPVVQTAKRFFAEQNIPDFAVYQNGPKKGWRTVSKLPVRKDESSKKTMIGMFQPQSHRISNSGNRNVEYPAHHPSINQGIALLTQACQEKGIEPYDEHSGNGYLRYAAMNVERATGKVQLTLVWNDKPYNYSDLRGTEVEGKKKTRKKKRRKISKDNNESTAERAAVSEGQSQLGRLIAHLLKYYAHNSSGSANHEEEDDDNSVSQSGRSIAHQQWQLHSLWIHYNVAWKHSNAIFDIEASDDSWQHIYGSKTIAEQLLTLSSGMPYRPTLHFGPNVFRQANLDAFSHIIDAIRKRIKEESKTNSDTTIKILELYGGVGTIGLHMLDLVSCITCSDENPHNRACFQLSLGMLTETFQNRASYVPKNARDMMKDPQQFLRHCNVLIVDPPRKGLDDVVLDSLSVATSNMKLLVYVSCGFDAFQRDYATLTKKHRWKLEHAEGHILFPGANAIETLAFFAPAN